jgi:hypothetical protein
MSRLPRITFAWICVLLVACTLRSASGQGVQSGRSDQDWDSKFTFVRKLILVAYPDLPPDPKMTEWTVSETSRDFNTLPESCGISGVKVDGLLIPRRDYSGHIINFGPVGGTLLSASLALRCAGGKIDGLYRVNFDGLWTNSEARDKLQTRFRLHHNKWSDTEIIQDMERAGARFGPANKAAFLNQIPLHGLGELLGMQLSIESAKFIVQRSEIAHFKPKNTPTSIGSNVFEPIVSPVWFVNLQDAQGGHVVKYVATFEPFGGRLISLTSPDFVRVGNRRTTHADSSQRTPA